MEYQPVKSLEEVTETRLQMINDIAEAASSQASAPQIQELVSDLHYVEGQKTALEEIETILRTLVEQNSTDAVTATFILSELALSLSKPLSDIAEGRYNDYIRTFRDGYLDACHGVAVFFSSVVRGSDQ